MKTTITALFLLLTCAFGFSQEKKTRSKVSAINKQEPKNRMVEASCGQCQFGITDKKGCDLAVRIDGKCYFVDGTKIDDHGEAHAEDGFCTTIRKAKVSGKIVGGRYAATSFELLSNKN